MKVGILVAMNKEASLFKKSLNETCSISTPILSYTTGTLNNTQVALCECGVGKVNAAIAATDMIEHFSPDVIISSGVAGSLSSSLEPLDKVIAEECAYYDVDCGSDVEKGQVQRLPKLFKADGSLVEKIKGVFSKIKSGLIVSGDSFIGNENGKRKVLELYPNALAVDMESCAIAHVCHKYGCPFLVVRIISDRCDENEYKTVWDKIGSVSFETVTRIIALLGKTNNTVSSENKIASFEVNHLHLKRGVYVSRKDKYGGETITTFDVRMKEPYKDKPLNQGAVHTIEHIGATYLRNNTSLKDNVVYWGPMGCLTGFYLVLHGDLKSEDVVPYLRGLFARVVESETIPGNSPSECGNYELHNLAKAKEEAASYWGLLMSLKDENIHYLQ